jgi:NTP pyrophosphatase (non-canonical NTP hydrolase)
MESTIHHQEKSTRQIREWQTTITDWAISKGFSWKRTDVNTMLVRLHSEVSEAAEAIRDNDSEGFAEELADIFIRLVNLCEVWSIDLEAEVRKKHTKNLTRLYLHGRKTK